MTYFEWLSWCTSMEMDAIESRNAFYQETDYKVTNNDSDYPGKFLLIAQKTNDEPYELFRYDYIGYGHGFNGEN